MVMSYTINLITILRATVTTDGGGPRGRSKDLGPHDHLIPRWLNWSSMASRRIFGMVRGRSTGICWSPVNGSYLLNGFFANAHSVARNAMMMTLIYGVARKTSVVG